MTESKKLEWADEQMGFVEADEDQKRQVQELLALFWKNADPAVLDMFTKLAQEEPLYIEEPEWRWLDAKPGNVYVRDVVRVRNNAYPRKDERNVHNGRTGVVVGIRYGTVSIHYTDANEEPSSFVQHRLPLLEKRY